MHVEPISLVLFFFTCSNAERNPNEYVFFFMCGKFVPNIKALVLPPTLIIRSKECDTKVNMNGRNSIRLNSVMFGDNCLVIR